MNDYKLVAPDIDSLLNCFERGFLNPSASSEDLCKAMDPLFEMLRDLAPLRGDAIEWLPEEEARLI